jgi:hypothetical protein
MTTTATSVFKSRWGFHPCSWEHSKKLRRLNFLGFKALSRLAALERWERKDPQNRVIRPKKGIPNRRKTSLGPIPKPILAPVDQNTFYYIMEDSQNARIPRATEAEVKPLYFPEAKIDEFLAQMEAWYGKPSVAKAG